jgi:hypothetical protein
VKADHKPFIHGHYPGAKARKRKPEENEKGGETQQDDQRRRWPERLGDTCRAKDDCSNQPDGNDRRDGRGSISAGVPHEACVFSCRDPIRPNGQR